MKKTYSEERRKYIRLNSVFPVEIFIEKSGASGSRLIQGFTHDVSLGGLCIAINEPDAGMLGMVDDHETVINITINMPVSRHPVEASVRLAWHDVRERRRYRTLYIGASFEKIAEHDRKRIVAWAHRRTWLPRAAAGLIVILAALLGASQFVGSQLTAENRQLIASFHMAQETADLYKRSLDALDAKYAAVKIDAVHARQTIDGLTAELGATREGDLEALKSAKAELEDKLRVAVGENARLEAELRHIIERRELADKLYRDALVRRDELGEATVANMLRWLTVHQNRLTGLVMSFEGDQAIRDWAFTYDESLAAQVFLIMNDRERAAKVLDFFARRAKRKDGGFCNAYNYMTGDSIEEIVHMGPNLWIGIAAAQYVHQTGDKTYLPLAESVARWVIASKDKEGGIRGGPRIEWYSTEHNLDAYALFHMLFLLTSKEVYANECKDTLRWIKDNAYSKDTKSIKRGKGDATIATDTLAWAVAAIGPSELLKEGMDPDGIMQFAEEHCLVTTSFERLDGQMVRLAGFDFAKAKNVARGGVVSSEWTAQMAVSYRVMGEFYAKAGDAVKSGMYRGKYEKFVRELDKMVISSLSPSGQGAGCLPYASQPNVDTGHGWRTPQGRQTGSVSGTAYAIFAKKGYNPLSFE